VPRLLLSDEELSDLVFKIISPNGAEKIIAAYFEKLPKESTPRLSSGRIHKDLGYKDYAVEIGNFQHVGGDVIKTDLQLWRPSRLLGFLGDKKVIAILTLAIRRRYFPIGANGLADLETKVIHEPDSYGHRQRWKKFDFIVLRFQRQLD
jgi:hypothetical protein